MFGIGGRGGLGRVQQQGKLTPQALRLGLQPSGQFGAGQGGHFLKLLGELAAHGEAARAQGRQLARQRGQAVRGLQQHAGLGLLRQAAQRLLARRAFGRQKAHEGKTRCRFGLDPAGHTEQGG